MHQLRRHQITRQARRVLSLLVVSSLALLMNSPSAFAGDAYGSGSTYSACGYSYYAENGIHTHTGYSTWADIFISVNGGAYPPAGCYGGQPYMYFSDGALCRIGGWVYNGNSQNYIDPSVSPGCGSGQVYYSQGLAAGWNGSGYVEYSTYPSPDQNS